MSTPRKPAKSTTRKAPAPKAPAKKPSAPRSSKGTTPTSPPPLTRGGPEARADAMKLLAEGYTVTSVAEALGVDRGTVREWRDSPAGRTELAAARKNREAAFLDAAEGARRILRENADRAAQELADQLDNVDPAVRSLAARTILDRVGVPRTQRIEQVPGQEDTSMLSDEELTAYEAVKRKMHKLDG